MERLERMLAKAWHVMVARSRLARSKRKAWGLPLLLGLIFVSLELALGNLLTIALGYLGLFFFILQFGLIEQSTPVRRAATFMLGMAVLCFGSGRMLYWFHSGVLTPDYEWLFDTGHLSLWTATALTVLDLRERRAVTAAVAPSIHERNE